MRNIIAVVMAGGSGKRLWPLSRKNLPKHLIPFDQEKTLLELTLERITLLSEVNSSYIVTTESQQDVISKILPDFKNYILEPLSRNTAAAILLSCLKINEIDPQAVVFFLPADHVIKDLDRFLEAMRSALEHAATSNHLILLGIKPNYPVAGYGYIEKSSPIKSGIFKVKKFHEKPSENDAENYVKQEMLWNSGIVCGQVSIFLEEFLTYQPMMMAHLSKWYKNIAREDYQALQEISFDYAVLEKSARCVVIPAEFTWSDVGTLELFMAACDVRKKNYRVIEYNAHNNSVDVSGKLVVLCGIEDMCIVDTGDVLLLCKKSNVENIKNIVSMLEKSEYQNFV